MSDLFLNQPYHPGLERLAKDTAVEQRTAIGAIGVVGAPTSGQIAEWTSGTSVQGVASTGTGAVMRAVSPTTTGTLTAAAVNASGNLSAAAITASGAITAPSLAASGSAVTTLGNAGGGNFLTGRITGNDIATTDSTYPNLTRLGHTAAFQNTGSNVTANGHSAAYQNTGSNVTANGASAAYLNTGSHVAANGFFAAYRNTGSNVTANGPVAAYENTGDDVTVSGFYAAFENTGNNVTASGSSAAFQNTGNNVTANGALAAYLNTGNDCVFVGHGSGQSNSVNSRFEVKQSPVNATPLLVGDFANNRLGIGVSSLSGSFNLQVAGSIGATGNLSAAAGTFTGNLSAVEGTFTGGLNFAGITKAALLALTPTAGTAGRWRVTDSVPAQRAVWPDGTVWRYMDNNKDVNLADEITYTPSGTTQTIPLNDGPTQTLLLSSATGTVTATLTIPSQPSSGRIVVRQGATPRLVTLAVSSGTFVLLGAALPLDAANTMRVYSWTYDGTRTLVGPSEASV